MERKYLFGALVTAALGYAIYFDYQRRNNKDFRRKLAKQRKEASKMKLASTTEMNASFSLPDEPIPVTNEGREQYFMKHLQLGEQLMQQGPPSYEAAATCFYRSLKVYPEPQKLLEVLSQSLPEIILSMIIQKMSDDVKAATTQGPAISEEVE